ncbi:MAG: c-type cytochrome domain-containing protein [Verrucomicrobiaceae bacterium]
MAEDHHSQEEEVAAAREGNVGLIFLTLFVLVLVGALVALPFFGDKEPIAKLLAEPNLVTEVLGNMHPLVLHLPIGIVFLTVFLEVCGWISFGKYRPVTTVGLFLAVLTGAAACVTGYIDMGVDGYAGEDWTNHMWAGIAFVGFLSLAFLSRVWGGRKGGRNPVYAILLVISAGVMGLGAHIGGEKIHGKTGVEQLVNTWMGKEAPVPEEQEDAAPGVTKPVADRLAYADVVVPILDNKCYACHSVKADKNKGDLYMDSWEALLEGGSEAAALVPGDVKESYMIEVIHLPKDDDMHMPPPKKEQLEEHEIAILDWWVASLPKSDELVDKTLTEMGAPPEILEAVGKLVSPEELAAMKQAEEDAANKVEEEKRKKRESLDSALGELKQDEQLKNAINYVSQKSSELEFTAVSLRQSMGDEQLAKLEPVAESLTSLQLGSTSVTEAALEAALPKMQNLKKLNLSQTAITDKGLDAVSKLSNLESLNLYGTKVSDEGIKKLKSLTNLKKLYLWDSQATPEGGEALKKELPQLELNFGIN